MINFNNKRYLIKSLRKMYIRIYTILFCLNITFYFSLSALSIISLQNPLNRENISKLYALGLFFNYKDVKKTIKIIILTCLLYYLINNLEHNFP